MRILFDGRLLDRLTGGLGRYVFNLVRWGLKNQTQAQIGVLTTRPERWEVLGNSLQIVPCRSAPYHPREQIELPGLVRRFRADLVHWPSLAVPLICPTPYVMTVADLIPWHFGGLLHRTYLRTFSRWTTRRARRVITISRHAAGEVNRFLWVPRTHLRTIMLGGLDGHHMIGEAEFDILPPDPYFLCVTNPQPHKNLTVLVEAFRSMDPGVKLIVVSRDTPALSAMLDSNPRIQRLSGLSDTQLKQLYRGAVGVVVPSLYEGFGLPALEAMQLEAPLICSNATSLPEVAGSAALYFDPRNPQELLERMLQLWRSVDLREELRRKGRLQAQGFSWESCCETHWQLYRELALR